MRAVLLGVLLGVLGATPLAAQITLQPSLGTEYLVMDSSVYPETIKQSDVPDSLLPFRVSAGIVGRHPLNSSMRVVGSLGLTEANFTGSSSESGASAAAFAVAMAGVVGLEYGKGPAVSVGMGYQQSLRSTIEQPSGLLQVVRGVWAGWYVSGSVVYGLPTMALKTVSVGVGYEFDYSLF